MFCVTFSLNWNTWMLESQLNIYYVSKTSNQKKSFGLEFVIRWTLNALWHIWLSKLASLVWKKPNISCNRQRILILLQSSIFGRNWCAFFWQLIFPWQHIYFDESFVDNYLDLFEREILVFFFSFLHFRSIKASTKIGRIIALKREGKIGTQLLNHFIYFI